MISDKISENLNYYFNKKEKKTYMKTLAEELDIGKTTLYSYFNGTQIPRSDMLLKLANYFNTTPNHLLGIYDYNETSIKNIGLNEFSLDKLISLNKVDKIINQKYDYKYEHFSYKISIQNSYVNFINLFLENATKDEIKAITDYIYYPKICNPLYKEEDAEHIMELYNNSKEDILKHNASDKLMSILDRIRNSKDMGNYILSLKAQKEKVIASKLDTLREIEEREIESLITSLNENNLDDNDITDNEYVDEFQLEKDKKKNNIIALFNKYKKKDN